MTKYSIGAGRPAGGGTPVAEWAAPGEQGRAKVCDRYDPGHQIHYTHQGQAVHSPSRTARNPVLDGTSVTLLLESGERVRWRHHDPERLERIIELLRGRCVVYPEHHALRVGPYWFNCATEDDEWQDCRGSAGLDPHP